MTSPYYVVKEGRYHYAVHYAYRGYRMNTGSWAGNRKAAQAMCDEQNEAWRAQFVTPTKAEVEAIALTYGASNENR